MEHCEFAARIQRTYLQYRMYELVDSLVLVELLIARDRIALDR
jgi:hypothetical protein